MEFWSLRVHLERKSCQEVVQKVSGPDLSVSESHTRADMDTNCGYAVPV